MLFGDWRRRWVVGGIPGCCTGGDPCGLLRFGEGVRLVPARSLMVLSLGKLLRARGLGVGVQRLPSGLWLWGVIVVAVGGP